MQQPSLQDLSNALNYVNADVPRDDWVRVLMGIKNEFGDSGFDIADTWSQTGGTYNAKNFKNTWRTIDVGGGTTINTVFKLAIDGGYKPEVKELTAEDKARFAKEQQARAKARAEQEAIALAERKRWHEIIAHFSQKILSEFTMSVKSNKYLALKKVNGFGVYAFKSSLIVVVRENFTTEVITSGASIKLFFNELPHADDRDFSFLHIKRGDLAIPLADINNVLWNIQIITGNGTKLFLKNGRKSGCFGVIGDPNSASVIAEAEGYATAASIHMATGWCCLYAFDAGNLLPVAKVFRPLFPDKPFVVCADDDASTKGNPGITKANEAASAVGGLVAIPNFSVVDHVNHSEAA